MNNTTNPHVLDVSDATFAREVIERSYEQPVLVDFWAAWCGPCRMLTPVLEKLAAEGEGRWRLAKINSDENQGLARRFNVRGIPNVKAFRDGKLVDEFVGALPRPQVQAFLDKLLPNAQDEQLAQARRLLAKGKRHQARTKLEQILVEQPDHDGAHLASAEVALQDGDKETALTHIAAIPSRGPLGAAAEQLRARAHFLKNDGRSLAVLRERVNASPDDLASRFELAQAAVPAGEYELAAEQLLTILERDPNWQDGDVRKSLLDLFLIMGEDDPRTAAYRKRMGWLLFA